jgi:hypothetical protein
MAARILTAVQASTGQWPQRAQTAELHGELED